MTGGFTHSISGGNGKLIVPSLQSPDYAAGMRGWAIKKDGSAEFNELVLVVQNTGQAILIYAGQAANGTLIGSWAAQDGTDDYDNGYTAGLNVSQGAISGIALDSATVTNTTLINALLQNPSISGAILQGGSLSRVTLTFDTSGGALFCYATTTTTITQTANGTYSFTCPAGVTSADIACWAAGAGGQGGNTSQGGPGGGAGEYAEEPNFVLVPGDTYSYNVGNGGSGGSPGNHGQDGGDTNFNPGTGNSVWAHGGNGNSTGGTGSGNSIHNDGGSGGVTTGTGGGGGGASGGPGGSGGNGHSVSGSSGGAGGTAGSNQGAGGSGGDNLNSGSNGSGPGGAGGGAGATSTSQNFSKSYAASDYMSYFGSDATGYPNAQRGNYPLYQGGETASGGSFNGTQKSLYNFPYSQMQSDLSGVSISSVSLTLSNIHSWYDSGLNVILGYSGQTAIPSSYAASDVTSVKTFSMAEGATKTESLPVSLGNAFKSGAAKSLVLGPGSAYNLGNYGYFKQAMTLNIQGNSGTNSPTYGGDGADGAISITYVTNSALVAAISPVAGTDANGNAYAAGYTGSVSAFQPGSSPLAVESWHNVTPPSGWSGTLRFRMKSDNEVEIQCLINNSSGASGTITLFNLPSAYTPSVSASFAVRVYASGATANASMGGNAQSNAVVNVVNAPSGTTEIAFLVTVPLD